MPQDVKLIGRMRGEIKEAIGVANTSIAELQNTGVDTTARANLDLLGEIKNTTQVITFDASGNVTKIEHTNSSGNILRTDTYVYSTGLISEKRVLSNGLKVIVTYNLNTFNTDIFVHDNLALYTSTTWAEWLNKGTYTVSDGYIVCGANTSAVLELPVAVKTSTKYGILLKVRSNTRSVATALCLSSGGNYPFPTALSVAAGATGAFKSSQITNASFAVASNYRAQIASNVGAIEFGDLYIFELPTGSVIETDFTNLSAAQLYEKYI